MGNHFSFSFFESDRVHPANFLLFRPPVSLVVHGAYDLHEPSDVAASDQAGVFSILGLDVFLCGVQAVLESVLHDLLELLVDFLACPAQALHDTLVGIASRLGEICCLT